MDTPHHCQLCPRRCGADRTRTAGPCGGGNAPRVAHAMAHHWEEPCISGTRGSGTVFFAGCFLGCVFCQNRAIHGENAGRPMDTEELAGLFCSLEAQGVHNLNLVTATHYRPWVQAALAQARRQGLALPVVWNTGGYETADATTALANDVDVWLFDLKFFNPELSLLLAGAADYFEVASQALQAAAALAGPPLLDADGLLKRGLVVRVLVLPGHVDDAVLLLHHLAETLPKDGFFLSLMCQYTPPEGVRLPPPLHRRLASYEYKKVCAAAAALGLERGYTQRRDSAGVAFIPPFAPGRA